MRHPNPFSPSRDGDAVDVTRHTSGRPTPSGRNHAPFATQRIRILFRTLADPPTFFASESFFGNPTHPTQRFQGRQGRVRCVIRILFRLAATATHLM